MSLVLSSFETPSHVVIQYAHRSVTGLAGAPGCPLGSTVFSTDGARLHQRSVLIPLIAFLGFISPRCHSYNFLWNTGCRTGCLLPSLSLPVLMFVWLPFVHFKNSPFSFWVCFPSFGNKFMALRNFPLKTNL